MSHIYRIKTYEIRFWRDDDHHTFLKFNLHIPFHISITLNRQLPVPQRLVRRAVDPLSVRRLLDRCQGDHGHVLDSAGQHTTRVAKDTRPGR